MTEEQLAPSEATMLYRKPTDGTDEAAIQDVWGKKLETRTVDSSKVPSLLAEGWATHPLDVGKKPEEQAGFVRDVQKTDRELTLEREARSAAEQRVDQLTRELQTASEQIAKLSADLKAAEALLAEKPPAPGKK